MSHQITTLTLSTILLISTIASAQPANPNQQGNARPQGAPPAAGAGRIASIDPADFKQQLLETIKDKLEPTDDEWKALAPKIEKVMEAQRHTRTGAGFSITRSSVAGTAVRSTGTPDSNTPVGKAMKEVRTAIDDKDLSPEELTKKVAAFREARDKAKADLLTAQKELKESITPRQEAILLTMNILD